MTESLRILIADDNPVDRLLLSTLVKKSGHEVVLAVDGNDAIEKYHEHEPEMILLDALMPGKDGFEVAEYVKRVDGDNFTPIIFLTSLTKSEDLTHCLDSGGDDFISKPYNKDVVRAKINALDRMRQLYSTVQEGRALVEENNLYMLKEQEAAKNIFDNITHTGCLDSNNVRYVLSALATFNGDVLLATRNPAGNMYVLLGDFTGHGLTAAIGAMPLSEMFYSMSQKGFSVGQVLREINSKLHQILPVGYFCCATMLNIDFHKRTVEVWSGGLPPGYIVHLNKGEVEEIEATNVALGIVGSASFSESTITYELELGDSIVLSSDGILEARNAQGEMYGMDRFRAEVEKSLDGVHAYDYLVSGVGEFLDGAELDDDVTLVQCFIMEEESISAAIPVFSNAATQGPTDWRMEYELGPKSLENFNPLPLMQQVLMEVPELREKGASLHTILAELYSNALDHGILDLESKLKKTPEGFCQYYEMRTERLAKLESALLRFEFVCSQDHKGGKLQMDVIDSGPGFDYRKTLVKDKSDSDDYHGRGLPLLYDLCESLEYRGCGNHVRVIFRWDVTEEH